MIGCLGASGALTLMPGRAARAREAEGSGAASRIRGRPSSDAGTASIPFTLHGRTGRIAVKYGVTEDPVAAGFDIVPDLGFDTALCRGYPTIHAVIEQYRGSGYRTLCGWIQVVTGRRYHTLDDDAGPADLSTDVDRLPAMADLDLPFAGFGILPELFDAPCRNLGGHQRLHWTADSFLTTVPMRSRSEEIRRLAGFRWGYTEYAPSARRPVSPLPLAVTGPDAWNDLLPFLRHACGRWRFAAA